jgi:hypothetical protein
MMHVQMVRENYRGYTKKKVLRAKEARQAQAMIGNLSKRDFKGMVSNHLISDCPIIYANIANVGNIFSLDLTSIQGKMV